MKKRLFSILLTLCLLLGVVAVPVGASPTFENGDSIYDPVIVQDLTGPQFSGLNVQVWDNDLIYYTIGMQGGLIDVCGNQILPNVYDQFSRVSGSYVCGWKNGASALFYRGRQLTEFRYYRFDRNVACFRADDINDNPVFFDDNGKIISVPKVWSGNWKVRDIIPNKAILLFTPERYYYDENSGNMKYESSHYMLMDWKGKVIVAETESMVQFRDAYSYRYKEEDKYFDGSTVKGIPDGYYRAWMPEFPNSQYIVLQKGANAEGGYYLCDTNYNVIRKLEVRENNIEPIIALSETLIAVRTPDGKSVIINAQGKDVAQLPGSYISRLGIEKRNTMLPVEQFLVCDGVDSYIYDKTGKQIALLKGATEVENANGYIIAHMGTYDRALYDMDGNLLFEYSSNDGIECVDGIIFRKQWDKAAVLDRDGTALTEYIFTPFNRMEYGITQVKISGKKGIFLINNRGQILNEQGYDEFLYNDESSFCFYKISGKAGFLRIVRPGEDIFTDVPRGTWYYDAVKACTLQGLFNGTSATTFSPTKPMTRAMLVTVLWRMDGEKDPQTPVRFADVEIGSWYEKAVAWASENGIVNGVGKDRFNPNGNVTREQMATILYRYAESNGMDVTLRADLSAYPDTEQISDYAKDAMSWAVAAGLINGNKIDETIYLQPKGNATRAQVATILIRYINNLQEG